MMKRQLFRLISAAVLAFTSAPLAFAAEDATVSYPITGKTPDGSYDYEVTKDGDEGDIFFDGAETDGGAFSCKWDSVSDCTFSKGHDYRDAGQSYKEFGFITCEYEMEYAPKGISQYGVHGWVESKESYDCGYAEFIIADGYNEWRPYEGTVRDSEQLGKVTIDGCTYDIYRICHTGGLDAPTSRSQVLYQYLSVVTPESNPVSAKGITSVSRRISIDEHFKAWEQAGIDMSGVLCEVSFWIVGARSSGEAKVTKNEITACKDTEPPFYTSSGKSPDGTYDCAFYRDDKSGTASFDGMQQNGGVFSCEWENMQESLFLKGHNIAQSGITYKALGDTACDYTIDFSADGISYFGIHGWIKGMMPNGSFRRLVEYYIIDGYNKWKPTGQPLGTVVDNGRTYDIFCICQTWAEWTQPEQYIYKYYSVISDEDNPVNAEGVASVSRHIDISKHFSAWDSAGIDMSGQISEVAFFVENWDCSGKASVSQNEITISSLTQPAVTEIAEYTKPPRLTEISGHSENISYQKSGKTPDGRFAYYGEAWNDSGVGEVALEGAENSSGAFSCIWNDVENCFFQKGPVLPQEQPYKSLGGLDCDYKIELNPQGIACFGIHGWVENNLPGSCQKAEFYIVDGFSEWRPNESAEPLGTVTADGCIYDIYQTKLSGTGAPICQYWSVIHSRNNRFQSMPADDALHHISITDHFKAWEQAGINLSGKLYEITFFVEGWYSSGKADIIQSDIAIGNKKGDIDGNGILEHKDARLLKAYLLGESEFPDNRQRADLNSDGILNAADLSLLKQKLLG